MACKAALPCLPTQPPQGPPHSSKNPYFAVEHSVPLNSGQVAVMSMSFSVISVDCYGITTSNNKCETAGERERQSKWEREGRGGEEREACVQYTFQEERVLGLSLSLSYHRPGLAESKLPKSQISNKCSVRISVCVCAREYA